MTRSTDSFSAADAPPRIRVTALQKRYPRNRNLLRFLRAPHRRDYTMALRGVDLVIPQGGIYALLGPNGAGKTTLLKALSGLLLANSGTIEIDGIDLTNEPRKLRNRVALAVCDERSFYWRISGRENLRFYATLNGLEGAARDRRIDECLAMVRLGSAGDRRYMEYSAGMRQSLALARGLLLDPPILLMDEPTRSLDPEATAAVHDVITGLQAADPSRVFFYSTHDLAEAESISSDVIVLRGGRIVMQRSLAREAGYVYRVRTHPELPERLLDDIDGLQVLGSSEAGTVVEFAEFRTLDAVLARLAERRLQVREVAEQRSRLGELYRSSAEAQR